MKKHKKSYCRCLCVILCALLFVPLLAAVPVYAADGDMYSYNGTVLPALPSISTSTYPYRIIYFDASIDTYVLLFLNVNLTKWTNDLRAASSNSGKYISYNLVDNTWSSRKAGSLMGQAIYCNFNEGDYLVWCFQDVLVSGQTTVFMSGSDPVLASPDPTVPTLTTSFDGQVISLDAGSLRFFITATNVNGTLSCQWYVNGAPISGEWTFIEAEPGVWLQGWVYTPVEYGTREIYCIVTNSIGDKSESVSTGTVIVHYGVFGGGAGGSGDLSLVTDKLDVLDMEISDLKQSVEQVQEGIDSINDSLTVTDPALNDAVGAFDEGSAEVDAFEHQQWQDFEENSHVITDQFQIFSDTGTMAGAFTLVSGIVHNTFNSLGPWQPVLTIPLAIAIILFIWSRAPGNDKPRKTDPVSKGNRYQGSPDGPGEFRKSPFYDSDRDQSPL